MKCWIGIDPGKSGALCALFDDGSIEFHDFETVGLEGYISTLGNIHSDIQVRMIGLEKVAAMPGQGVVSVFSFGQRFGELEGMLQTLKLGYATIRPKEWQKDCGIVMPKKATSTQKKKTTYELINKLYPTAELKTPRGKILDGRCDALGIAHAIRKTYQ